MMLAGLSVLAAQQCAEAEAEAAEPPENMLSYGLTHLWTSPILRYQLMKQGHASLQLLEAAVLDLVAVGTPVAACTASFRACTEWSSAMGSSWRCPVAVCATSAACAAPADLSAMPCSQVLDRYAAFRDNCTLKQLLRPGETANDAWFAEQRDAFQRGEDSWLEEDASGTAVAAAMVIERHSNLGPTDLQIG